MVVIPFDNVDFRMNQSVIEELLNIVQKGGLWLRIPHALFWSRPDFVVGSLLSIDWMVDGGWRRSSDCYLLFVVSLAIVVTSSRDALQTA